MFTLEELKSGLRLFSTEPDPPIHVFRFRQFDFPSAASEESMMICRGTQSDFESAIHFWLTAQPYLKLLETEDELRPYVHEALFQPMDEEQFMERLNQTQGLKYPFTINPKGKYLRGQIMNDEWNDYSALAEFEQEFIYFDWGTSA